MIKKINTIDKSNKQIKEEIEELDEQWEYVTQIDNIKGILIYSCSNREV